MATRPRTRLVRLGLAVLALAAAVSAGGAWWYRAELDEARREVDDGRMVRAHARLVRLQAIWPGQGEVEYLLGACEQARGNRGAAIVAWSRVPSRSPHAGAARLGQARLEQRRGRLAQAETLLVEAARTPGPHAAEARRTLVTLLRLEGRLDDVRSVLREGWSPADDPLGVLRQLAALDTAPFPVEAVRSYLAKAARSAPDDDRVWLGLANLATRTGQFEDAARWLQLCARRRPDDRAVWQAWLEWALASDRPDEAARAVPHLAREGLSQPETLSLRAWAARLRDDARAEEHALESLAGHEPGNFEALERLAELAIRNGRPEEAARLRERKRDAVAAREQYQRLIEDNDPTAQASELERLARTLGWRFEARCWASLALRRTPTGTGARALLAALEQPRASDDARPGVAELLADLQRASEKRPPTEVAAITPQFADDAERAGLRFVYDNGQSPERQLPETMGGGVALLDYDGDGWLDVFLTQGGHFLPSQKSASEQPGNGDRLFRNRGDGSFDDVTAASAIASLPRGYGHGVAVGDYDNDGHPDLLLTRWRSYALWHNRGDGTFEDATERAGLAGDRDWPTSAAWADWDNDGDLDLYVCHYLDWDAAHPRLCRRPDTQAPIYCAPREFSALPDHLFRNDGGRFVDVSAEAGITAADHDGRGLGVVAADFDGDGLLDLFVANDMSANFLFRNRGNLRFEEDAQAAGVACNASGSYQAGMGIACGDTDRDGRLDLAVTNFYGESTSFFQNLGDGRFSDRTSAVGLAAATRYLLGFGAAFLDANNDGWLDLATANGHVNDGRPRFAWTMPAQLFVGTPGGRFVEVSERAGSPWRTRRLGRGLAAGDLDHDGRIDLVLLAQNAPVAFFHNRTEGGHFLILRLEGTASNRDGIGAVVRVTSGGQTQTAARFGGGSYASASDLRLHFGLGPAEQADRVEVTWPSGRVDRLESLRGDTGYLVREGDARARPLKGFGPRR